jgi:hypothetical protein
MYCLSLLCPSRPETMVFKEIFLEFLLMRTSSYVHTGTLNSAQTILCRTATDSQSEGVGVLVIPLPNGDEPIEISKGEIGDFFCPFESRHCNAEIK